MPKIARMEKLSVTLPAELVHEIRSVVPQGEVSNFLAEAAKEYLVRHKLHQALAVGYGAWSDEQHPELISPQDSIHFVRELRGQDKARLSHLEAECE